MEIDMSDRTLSGVLSQEQDGKWHPIMYYSKLPPEAEYNYEIYDKEMPAIMSGISEWHQYLMGAYQDFEIWTNHQNLAFFHKAPKLDFELHSLNEDLLSQIKKHSTDQEKKSLLASEPLWNEDTGRSVTWCDYIYVPKNAKLQGEIIHVHHDPPITEHPDQCQTLELITWDYWWPSIRRDVNHYVEGCTICQKTKPNCIINELLHPNKAPSQSWETITINFIIPLPKSLGYNAICTIIDQLSKSVILIPTHKDIATTGTARIFHDHVFQRYSIPQKIISDWGQQFVSGFAIELYSLLSIEGNLLTAYHPQTNKQLEQLNHQLEIYLQGYVNTMQDDWLNKWLSTAEFVYNNTENSSTCQTPFFINFGCHPYKGTNVQREAHQEEAGIFVDTMKKVHDKSQAAITWASDAMKQFYNQSKGNSIAYKKGNKVWLKAKNLKTMQPMEKNSVIMALDPSKLLRRSANQYII